MLLKLKKKAVSLLLSCILVFSLTPTAFAAKGDYLDATNKLTYRLPQDLRRLISDSSVNKTAKYYMELEDGSYVDAIEYAEAEISVIAQVLVENGLQTKEQILGYVRKNFKAIRERIAEKQAGLPKKSKSELLESGGNDGDDELLVVDIS